MGPLGIASFVSGCFNTALRFFGVCPFPSESTSNLILRGPAVGGRQVTPTHYKISGGEFITASCCHRGANRSADSQPDKHIVIISVIFRVSNTPGSQKYARIKPILISRCVSSPPPGLWIFFCFRLITNKHFVKWIWRMISSRLNVNRWFSLNTGMRQMWQTQHHKGLK